MEEDVRRDRWKRDRTHLDGGLFGENDREPKKKKMFLDGEMTIETGDRTLRKLNNKDLNCNSGSDHESSPSLNASVKSDLPNGSNGDDSCSGSNTSSKPQSPIDLQMKNFVNCDSETTLHNIVNKAEKSDTNVASNGKLNGPLDPTAAEDESSPDSVIVLSDGEEGAKSKVKLRSLTKSLLGIDKCTHAEREDIVRMLKSELRNEEAKLVLLKKIRQSQQIKEALYGGAHTANVNSVLAHPSLKAKQQTQLPPPLLRGIQQSTRGLSHTAQPIPHSKPQAAPPPLLMAPSRGRDPTGSMPANLMLQHMSRTAAHGIRSGATPPNIVMGYQTQKQAPSATQDNQTPAQRQAAAKLALRKQLEKTLLQIPPPKPPPPELNFIPCAQNAEFVYLLGLEEAVKYLTENDPIKGKPAQPVKYVFNPFRCVQCKTDFTTVWKRDKPNSKNVICEQCVTSNQKKALKAEHTNRLKSAFVKALQQEQEIEQRIQSQAAAAAATADTNTTSSELSTATTTTTTTQSAASSAAAAAVAVASAMNPKLAAEAMRHQSLLQSSHLGGMQLSHLQNLHLLPRFIPTTSTLGYPYGLIGPQAHQRSTADMNLHRQYLLDMIPPQAMPKSNVSWKN